MNKFFLKLHVLCLAVALTVVSFLYWPTAFALFPRDVWEWIVWSLPLFAGTAFVSGIIEMSQRSGKSESITLAFSTIVSFLLSLFTAGLALTTRALVM